jgi:hypothetical protein
VSEELWRDLVDTHEVSSPPRAGMLMLSMIARLGIVLYWFGCLLAVAALIIGGAVTLNAPPNPAWGPLATGAGVGVVFWLIGRACLFVLAGR